MVGASLDHRHGGLHGAGAQPVQGLLAGLKEGPSLARADQNRFNSHQPIRPSQNASLPKAITANTMTANDIGGSQFASTAAATKNISVAACASVIAEILQGKKLLEAQSFQAAASSSNYVRNGNAQRAGAASTIKKKQNLCRFRDGSD
jgi:hypothetical protein